MLPANLPSNLRHVAVDANGCWIWNGSYWSKTGNRPRVAVGYGRWVAAHRAAYEALVGPIPKGLTLDHLCYVPQCVNPEHLEPCSLSENSKRFHAKFGSAFYAARRSIGRVGVVTKRKLTDAQVTAIFADARPVPIIANEAGVSVSSIYRIKSGDRWSALTGARADAQVSA